MMDRVEKATNISFDDVVHTLLLDGPYFFLEPIPLGLLVVTVVFLAANIWSIMRDRRKSAKP